MSLSKTPKAWMYFRAIRAEPGLLIILGFDSEETLGLLTTWLGVEDVAAATCSLWVEVVAAATCSLWVEVVAAATGFS